MKILPILTLMTALLALMLLPASASADGCTKDQKCLPALALKTTAITISIVKEITSPSGVSAPVEFANTGNAALNWRFYVGSVFNGCATPVPASTPWLTVSPASGTLGAGQSATALATVSARDLPVGIHHAVLCLATDDRDSALTAIAVTVTVKPAQ